ncbi:1-acyl-sn-glycerol-3-phosphate acyltransferase [Candidatus Magnetomoraceae bacterium gMMP-15]
MKNIKDYFITLYIIVWTLFLTILFAIITITISFFDSKGNLPHISARWWARLILFGSRIPVTVTGLENIDPAKTYIYMPNHQSNFDIPILLGYLKVQFRWLAKAELFKIPVFGFSMRRAGYISINRSNRRAAFESLKLVIKTIQNGTSTIIFPEGTRSMDGKLNDFKKGGFVTAMKAGVPIIPIVIHGTYQIMPKKQLLIKPRPVRLEIKAPITIKNYMKKEDIMEDLRGMMIGSLKNQ